MSPMSGETPLANDQTVADYQSDIVVDSSNYTITGTVYGSPISPVEEGNVNGNSSDEYVILHVEVTEGATFVAKEIYTDADPNGAEEEPYVEETPAYVSIDGSIVVARAFSNMNAYESLALKFTVSMDGYEDLVETYDLGGLTSSQTSNSPGDGGLIDNPK